MSRQSPPPLGQRERFPFATTRLPPGPALHIGRRYRTYVRSFDYGDPVTLRLAKRFDHSDGRAILA
jgi:hypothetical protein